MTIQARLLLFSLAATIVAACGSGGGNAAQCDSADACSHQSELTFCDIDGVYPDSSLANECIAPPSDDACNRIETCETAGKPHCTDDSMGVCVECTDGSHCADGKVCDQTSHECLQLSCTPGATGDASCVAADATLPRCGPDESCVACLVSADCTTATAAICDPTDLECRGCAANTECDSKVCGMDTGLCADESEIVYVKGSPSVDLGDCGTLAKPCATITAGLSKVNGTRKTVLVAAGSYSETLVIAGKTVDIVGDGAVTINVGLLSADTNGIMVSGNADVSFDTINVSVAGSENSSVALRCTSGGGSPTLSFANGKISGSGGVGVVASNCDLTVTGSTISGNAGGGVTSSSGSLTVTGSKISGNPGGGIFVSGSNYTITNNFISFNGNGTGAVSGFKAEATSTKSELLEFNTFAGNVRSGVAGFAVICDATALTARNNIFMLAAANSAGLTSGDCTHAYSLFDSGDATAPSGSNNISAEALFVDADTGDLHLQAGSPGIDSADPASTINVDIDGDPRPAGNGFDMGAHEFQ